MTRRLSGMPAREWSHGMLDAIAALRPPTGERGAGRRRGPQGHAALETFALHPDLARAFFGFNRHILWGTSLPPRLRHIVILRVAARRRAAFLWSEHVPQGRDSGLSDEEIGRIAAGDRSSFTELEAALLEAVDDLVDKGVIGADTWKVLASDLIPPQLLDVVFTAGCYETVSWMVNSIELEVDAAVMVTLPGMGTDGDRPA